MSKLTDELYWLKIKDCDNEIYDWYNVRSCDVARIVESCLLSAKKIEIRKEK